MDADTVLHQEQYELLAIHQSDRSFVALCGFFGNSFTEVAGGDNQALFVCSETAAHLLYHRSQNVVLEFPLVLANVSMDQPTMD